MEATETNQTIEETIPVRPQVSSDLIKWMITGDDIAEAIEVELTGRRVYNGKLIVVNPYKTRMINDIGINSLKLSVTSNIGKGPVNSNLTQDEIYRLCEDLWADIIMKLYCHWQEWGIEPTDATSIRMAIVNNVLYSLKRAKEGQRDIELWAKGIKRTEAINNSPKKGPGFLNWMGMK